MREHLPTILALSMLHIAGNNSVFQGRVATDEGFLKPGVGQWIRTRLNAMLP